MENDVKTWKEKGLGIKLDTDTEAWRFEDDVLLLSTSLAHLKKISNAAAKRPGNDHDSVKPVNKQTNGC